MNDYIDKTFSDLDDFYPGSKRKRKPVAVKEPEVEPNVNWDAKPYVKTLPNGRDLEMFTIGALANALGRPIITIRQWIEKGYLPASPYRLPTKKTKNGDDFKGRRLYSRAMVEKVVELFESAGILYVNRIDWTTHRQLSNQIAEAWSNIRAEENK